MVNLLDFDAEGLTAWFAQLGEKPFRARQVLRWMHRFGEDDFEQMTDVAKSLRAKLAEAGRDSRPRCRCANQSPPTARASGCWT